jgi:hypothetical protein
LVSPLPSPIKDPVKDPVYVVLVSRVVTRLENEDDALLNDPEISGAI